MNTGKDVATSADQWFTHLTNAKALMATRDKAKKEFDHYDKKTAKMRADRQAKAARNPKNVETPKDAEWYLRNDRKCETAQNNYITMSQQSYTAAKECLDLRFEFMAPVMTAFAGNLAKFFKGTANACSGLASINEKISQAQAAVKRRTEEAKLAELRAAEERVRREREAEEKAARQKLEQDRILQEKLIKERQDAERELAAKYSGTYQTKSAAAQPQTYTPRRPRPPPPPQSDSYEDTAGSSPASYTSYPAPDYSGAGGDYYTESPPTYRPRPRPRRPPPPQLRPVPQPDSYPDPAAYDYPTAPQYGSDQYYAEPPSYYSPPPRRPPPRPICTGNEWDSPQPQSYQSAAVPIDPFSEIFVSSARGPRPRNPFSSASGGGSSLTPTAGGYYARPAPAPQQQPQQYDAFEL